MEQKLVTYEVAKALKEAGYPQGGTPYQYVTKNYDTFKEGEVIDSFYENWAGNNVIDIPTYLDVWLWLWREKKIRIEIDDMIYKIYDATEWVDNYGYHLIDLSNNVLNDPEKAIIAAIDYLVENNLIK